MPSMKHVVPYQITVTKKVSLVMVVVITAGKKACRQHDSESCTSNGEGK